MNFAIKLRAKKWKCWNVGLCKQAVMLKIYFSISCGGDSLWGFLVRNSLWWENIGFPLWVSGFIVRQTQLESLPTSRIEDLPLVQQKKGPKCRRPLTGSFILLLPSRAHVTNRQQPGLTAGNRCDIVTPRSSFTMEIPSITSIKSLQDKNQGTEVHAKMCSQVVFAVLSLFSLKSYVLKRGA